MTDSLLAGAGRSRDTDATEKTGYLQRRLSQPESTLPYEFGRPSPSSDVVLYYCPGYQFPHERERLPAVPALPLLSVGDPTMNLSLQSMILIENIS